MGSSRSASARTTAESSQQGAARTRFADMAPLVLRVRDFLDARGTSVTAHDAAGLDPVEFASRTGFLPRRSGRPQVVLGSDTAVELGHPSAASQATVLRTRREGLVEPGLIRVVGPDLDEISKGERPSLAVVAMLALGPEEPPDPFELETALLLTNRLPGFMVRSVPGRLWVRVGRAARAAGLTLRTVGEALLLAFGDGFPQVRGVEVLFVTSSREDVEALEPVVVEARILAGQHKRLVLSADGVAECSELTCESCDERPVCDSLRDVVIRRRRRGGGATREGTMAGGGR